MESKELRLECLKLASTSARTSEEILNRADDYVEWVTRPQEILETSDEPRKSSKDSKVDNVAKAAPTDSRERPQTSSRNR